MRAVGVHGSVEGQVVRLARLAKSSGLDGVVASAREAPLIRRKMGKGFIIVTPGVRGEIGGRRPRRDDQKRVVTAREAFNRGADFIVVGRPVTEAADPLRAVRRLLDGA